MGDKRALTVVGVGHGTTYRETRVIAGMGTWAALPGGNAELSQLSGSIRVSFPEHADLLASQRILADVLIELDPVDSLRDPQAVLDQVVAATWDRDRVARTADTPWTRASPMSFWLPGLTLLPLAVMITFLAVARRSGGSLRTLVMVGLSRHTAVASMLLATGVWCGFACLAGAVVGTLGGVVAARLAASSFGNPQPAMLFPIAGVLVAVVGLAVGAAVGWLILNSASRDDVPRRTQPDWIVSLAKRGTEYRRTLGVLLAALGVWVWTRMSTSADALWFGAFGLAVAAVLLPEVVPWVAAHLPDRGLRSRLTKRLFTSSLGRMTTTATLIALSIAISSAFVTTLSSYLADQRARAAVSAVAHQVILDNDGSAPLPVPSGVRRAAETVPSLGQQEPVQAWYAHSDKVAPGGADAAHQLGVNTDFAFELAQSFSSVSDLERAYDTQLSPDDRRLLQAGGALAIGEGVRLGEGQLTLTDGEDPDWERVISARRARLVNDPISRGVGVVMLNRGAESAGAVLTPGALIYTHLTESDAAAVRAALIDHGIHPENAWIYVVPASPVPDLALLASGAGLALAVLLLVWSAIRAQVLAIRSWVNNLGRLGVKRSWVLGALLAQYVWLLGVGVAAGLLAGLMPVLAAQARLPALVIDVPWVQIAGVVLGLTIAA
ncbi:MAG: hypothetical protein WAW88_06285, partial [Nocardioides sp.]